MTFTINGLNTRYRRAHPEMEAKFKRDEHHRLRIKVLMTLGGKCAKCGYDSDSRALQIDHIFGDGAKDRMKFCNYPSLYRHILRDSTRYQLLCANCNAIKQHENNEIPRKWSLR